MTTLEQADILATALEELVDAGCRTLADRSLGSDGAVDQSIAEQEQGLLFDLATLSSSVTAGREIIDRMGEGDLALAHLARVAAEASRLLIGRRVPMAPLDAVRDEITAGRDIALLSRIADRVLSTGEAGPRALAGGLRRPPQPGARSPASAHDRRRVWTPLRHGRLHLPQRSGRRGPALVHAGRRH
jgi:hypothetical protein